MNRGTNGRANSPLNTEAVSSRLNSPLSRAAPRPSFHKCEAPPIDRTDPVHTRQKIQGLSHDVARELCRPLDAPSRPVSHGTVDPSFSNPYQAPVADEPRAPDAIGPGEHASRIARLFASMADAFIGFVVMFPVQIWAGVYDGFPALKPQEFPKSLFWLIGSLLLWIALHGRFLAKSAQTIGKKLLGLQIVMVDTGRPASFERLVFWRFLPMMLVAQIPFIGVFLITADLLFIFREDRRCLHDFLAGTRVIDLDKN